MLAITYSTVEDALYQCYIYEYEFVYLKNIKIFKNVNISARD